MFDNKYIYYIINIINKLLNRSYISKYNENWDNLAEKFLEF